MKFTEADGGEAEHASGELPIGAHIQLNDGREIVKVDGRSCSSAGGRDCLFRPMGEKNNRLCNHFRCNCAVFLTKHDYLALKLIGEEP